MIKLIDELAVTPNANKRFKLYYMMSNWALQTPFADFLKQDFRYQLGVFLDYLNKENYGIIISHSGYMIYVLANKHVDPKDVNELVFTKLEDGTLLIDFEDVEHEPHIYGHPDLMIQETYKRAILKSFSYIHTMNDGHNTTFTKKLKKLSDHAT